MKDSDPPAGFGPFEAFEVTEFEDTRAGNIIACEPSLRRSIGTSFFLSCFSFSRRALLSSSGLTNKSPDSSSSCLSSVLTGCLRSESAVVYFLIRGGAIVYSTGGSWMTRPEDGSFSLTPISALYSLSDSRAFSKFYTSLVWLYAWSISFLMNWITESRIDNFMPLAASSLAVSYLERVWTRPRLMACCSTPPLCFLSWIFLIRKSIFF
jgi:hypothetical protein